MATRIRDRGLKHNEVVLIERRFPGRSWRHTNDSPMRDCFSISDAADHIKHLNQMARDNPGLSAPIYYRLRVYQRVGTK